MHLSINVVSVLEKLRQIEPYKSSSRTGAPHSTV
jgi:hypothetical protein